MSIRPDDFDAVAPHETQNHSGVRLDRKGQDPRATDRNHRWWLAAMLVTLLALGTVLGLYIVARGDLATALAQRDATRQELDQLRNQVGPTVTIDRLWTEQRVQEGSQSGMRIHLKFQALNLQYEPMQMIALFYLEDGTALRSSAPGFRTVTGTLAAWHDFSPASRQQNWDNAQMFLPYSVIDLPQGQVDFKYDVLIRRKGGDWKLFAQSEWEQANMHE